MELNRRRYLGSLGTTATVLALAAYTSDESDSSEGNANGNSGDSDTSNSDDSDGDDNGGDTNSENNDDSSNQSDVEIVDHEFYDEEFQSGVRATAVNNTDNDLSYVEATATFLDADGTQIGEGLDNVNDLAAGREWEFDCMYTSQNASRIEEYEIEVSTGF